MRVDTARADFAIEIRERYGDVARDCWPVSVDPLADELLSSWLHRLALANGIAPRSFAGVFGLDERMWSPRLDLQLPRHVAGVLADETSVPQGAISAMMISGCSMATLLLPLRDSAHRNRSTWMQYCPQCLATDEAPYFRRQWRLASRVSCFVHGCGLRDRCPACRAGVAAFDHGELLPQHICARCGFDLRAAPKAKVNAAARQLERAIADICRVEAVKSSTKTSDAVTRVQRMPIAAEVRSGRTLTNLSTAARIRCFEALAAKTPDWLVNDMDAAGAYRRWMIVAAGGHEPMIARFADFLDAHQRSPRRKRSPPVAGRSALFAAYFQIMRPGDGHRGRPPAPTLTIDSTKNAGSDSNTIVSCS
ncbi:MULTISPECIES: TniQ family protein [Phyllobacteriaceae]|uniref:TniQ family protein n=1 Tax=Neoaquamicrobium sediminum TaxID=1849104 RepID=A0ABV3WZ96_9HYPH|nr:TniQ family protein [Afipia sp.]